MAVTVTVKIWADRAQAFSDLTDWINQHANFNMAGWFMALLAMTAALFLFALRRWRELERENLSRLAVEKELRESEERLRNAMAVAPDLFLEIDLQGNILFINRLEDEKAPSQALKLNVVEMTHPDHRQRLRELMQRCAQDQKRVSYEILAQDSAQEGYYWYGSLLSPRYRQGKLAGFFLVTRYIHHRKEMEELLQQDEKRQGALLRLSRLQGPGEKHFLQALLEEATALTGSQWGFLATLDRDGSCFRMFLRTPCARDSEHRMQEELALEGESPWKKLLEDRAPQMENALDPARQNIPLARLRFLALPFLRDGAVWAALVVTDKKGFYSGKDVRQLSLLIEESRHFLDRRRVEERMQAQRDLMDAVIRSIPMPLFAKDREGRYVLANPAFLADFGFDEKDILGKTAHQVWGSEDSRVFHSKDLELMERSGVQVYEHNLTSIGGESKTGILTKACYHDGQGRVSGLVGTFMDITERKKQEEKLRESARLHTLLLREVNHRVKNHLLSLQGMITKARMRLENQQSSPGQVFDELRCRVGSLLAVHQLLSQSGWRPLDMEEVARQVFRETARGLGITLEQPPRMDMDPLEILPEQAQSLALIINELVTNSWKHGGEKQAQSIKMECRYEPQNRMAKCRFSDQGKGFPAAILEGRIPLGGGLDLIRNLVEGNLEGTLTLSNAEGALVEWVMPVKGGLSHDG